MEKLFQIFTFCKSIIYFFPAYSGVFNIGILKEFSLVDSVSINPGYDRYINTNFFKVKI